jgi:cytochrome P450
MLQLRDDLKTFLFAGHDTSATVSAFDNLPASSLSRFATQLLTWAVWELSQHPQMFDRHKLSIPP